MTVARNFFLQEDVEKVYYCISTCREGSALRSIDKSVGRSYDHRKGWIQDRLMELSDSFAIEICAYSVSLREMHVVLRTRPDWVNNWTDREVAHRWLLGFPKKKGRKRIPVPPEAEDIRYLAADPKRMKELRGRLSSVSWFMRGLNEFIGRRANKEDDYKGRFWTGRFKCQVLLDESAYLACMAYVDLIPVLEGLKQAFDQCAFNSAYQRFSADRIPEYSGSDAPYAGNDWLCPIGDEAGRRGLLPISSDQYQEVLDWTQNHLKERKRRPLPEKIRQTLLGLNIDDSCWMETVKGYGQLFQRVAGRSESIKAEAKRVGNQWLCGFRPAEKLFIKKNEPKNPGNRSGGRY